MRESEYLEGKNHLIDLFKNIPVFQQFSQESLLKIMRLSKIQTYEDTEKIIREGELEKCLFLLISGRVIIKKNEKTIARFQRAGDIFGEMSLLDQEPRSATVIADGEVSCLVIDAVYLDSLDEAGKNSFHAAIYHMFAQILAYRLRVTTEQYSEAKKEIEKLKAQLR